MILANASPFGLTLSIAAAAGYALSAMGASRLGTARLGSAQALMAVRMAWLLHAIILAWSLFGPEPRFGFAPALSMTAWLVAGVYAIESHLYPLLKRCLPWVPLPYYWLRCCRGNYSMSTPHLGCRCTGRWALLHMDSLG
jgi:hypothetical protein